MVVHKGGIPGGDDRSVWANTMEVSFSTGVPRSSDRSGTLVPDLLPDRNVVGIGAILHHSADGYAVGGMAGD